MSNLVFEKLAQALTAGQVWRLAIGADFFRIAACAWPLKVRILKAGRILGEMDGWQAGDYMRGVDFDAVEVENGSQAQAVTVQIAGGGVGSDRVIGEVSVIDGSRADTEAGKAFCFYSSGQGAVGERPHVQILNPAGSGKVVTIKEVVVSADVAGNISMFEYSTPLPTLVQKSKSKKAGNPDGSTECRSHKTGTFIGPQNHGTTFVAASGDSKFSFGEPLVLSEGRGFGFSLSTLGTSILTVSAQGMEE